MNIKEILDSHKLWLQGDPKGIKANLSRTNLSGVDLSRADLPMANLSGANLFGIIGKEIMTFQFNRHFAYASDGHIKIGCQYMSIKDWMERYEQIGKENNYSEKEILVYGDWIKLVDRRLK